MPQNLKNDGKSNRPPSGCKPKVHLAKYSANWQTATSFRNIFQSLAQFFRTMSQDCPIKTGHSVLFTEIGFRNSSLTTE